MVDWQLIDGWGTDSSNAEVLDFTRIPYTAIVSYQSSELSLVKILGMVFSDVFI